MSELTKLSSLQLQYCALTGQLPTWFKDHYRELKLLGLSNNHFTGMIPTSISSMASLQTLALDDNHLNANIQDFASLENIMYLYLEDNKITGQLTNAVLDKWKQTLVELDLSSNQIIGELPSSLFDVAKNLTILDLSSNFIAGTIPNPTTATTTFSDDLQFLAMQNNELSGMIPIVLQKMTGLSHLDLSQNKLDSTIPTFFQSLTNLRYLFLGSNSYDSQSFPTVIETLTNLRELSLKDSKLVGQLPVWLGNKLKLLQLLDLDVSVVVGFVLLSCHKILKLYPCVILF